MPALTPEPRSSVLHHRARLNALQRHRDPDDPAIAEARRELAVASIEEHVRRVVDQAPPLTAEQIERVRALLPAPPADDLNAHARPSTEEAGKGSRPDAA